MKNLPKRIKDKGQIYEALNEELWDSSRVSDLVRYYLDRYDNLELDVLVRAVKKQMIKEGSTLPSSDDELRKAVYEAIDDYEEEQEMYDEDYYNEDEEEDW